MNNIYYSSSEKLNSFASALKKNYKVFVPYLKDSLVKQADYFYSNLSDSDSFVYNAYRTVEPLKSFFTYAKEKVTDYFNSEDKTREAVDKTVIFGVKSCDIAGHKVQDFVFMEGVETDSLYLLRRENTILISSDCTDFKDVCHCLAWEILPHPSEGFDLNLSPLNEGYLVEVGSGKGEDLLKEYQEYFVPAREAQVSARKIKRDNLIERLRKHLLPQNLVSRNIVQRLMKEGLDTDTWRQFMLTCVECGGCNLACDTCHCFLLHDNRLGQANEKVRSWDCCLYPNYARVAGGANPLKTRAHRLRNRFVKKFDFFVDNLGMPACCGCGRCIEVCPGKIDIREVLKDLAQKTNIKK